MPVVVLRQRRYLLANLFQDHDCQNRETKLVHHTQSRLRDESNHVRLPHGHESWLHVGCLRGIFPSFKTNHIPLMNGFMKRRKTPYTGSGESCPQFPMGTGTGCESTGEGGAFALAAGPPRVCSVRLGRGDKSGCAGHRHDVRLREQVVGCPPKRLPQGVPSHAGGTLLERPDPLAALTTTAPVPRARPKAPSGKRSRATLFAYTWPLK